MRALVFQHPYRITALTSLAAIGVYVYFTEQGKQPVSFIGISVSQPEAVSSCLQTLN
jgi:hypothetical protein